MSVRIFNNPLIHWADRPDADPRLAYTTCDIRFAWDSQGYDRAMRVTGNPRPSARCPRCFA